MTQWILASVLVITSVALSGCAKQLTVMYQSDPAGAGIYQGGNLVGRTPLSLTYQVTEEEQQKGSKTLQSLSARWVSGATVISGPIATNFNQHGYSQVYTFTRPDAPGLDQDVNFAIQNERNQAINQAADAAKKGRRCCGEPE